MSELEDYKQEFLDELDKFKQQYNAQEQNSMMNTAQNMKQTYSYKVTNTNDIWNTTKYSDNKWRQNLTTTYYNQEHNKDQFNMNMMLNPEVKNKNFNMRATQISEYSNAKHNNTVFVNPKFTSC